MSNRLGGLQGTAYLGTNANQPPNWTFNSRAPTQYDTDYSIGDLWLDAEPSLERVYVLVSLAGNSTSAGPLATWLLLASSLSEIITITGNDSVVVPASAGGNINIVGDGTSITTTGDALTNTLTISAIPGGTSIETLTGNSGGAVGPTAGNVNVMGDGTFIKVTGNPATHTLTIAPVNGTGFLESLGGNTGTSFPTAGKINIVTAHSTPIFAAAGSTLTLDFALTSNLVLGTTMPALTSGTDNVGMGNTNFTGATSAADNTAIGFASMPALTTGSDNCALGSTTMTLATTAIANVAVGLGALSGITTGIDNTCVGSEAGSGFTVGSEGSNICIGSGVLGIAGQSNSTTIGIATGGSKQTSCIIGGIYNVTPSGTPQIVVINSSGQLGSQAEGTGFVGTLTGNSGGAVGPSAQNINVVGDSTTVNVVGDPVTSTLTISASGSTPTSFVTDSGTAAPSANVLDVNGGNNIGTTGAGNVIHINVTGTTNHAVQLGNSTGSLTSAAVGTNGQVLIGATGASPAFATLTSTGGTITYTLGANTLDLEAAGSVPTSFVTSAGTAVPAGNVLNLINGNNIVMSGAGNDVTVNVAGTTNHAVQIGNATNSLTSLTVGTNGQVLLGATGANPAFATLTSSDSSISFTTGANTLSLQVTGGTTVGKTITGNTGGALSPTAGNWNILGSHGLNTAGAGSTLTAAINNAITLGDLANLTAGVPALTLSTGDLTISATNSVGNINLPVTGASGDSGVITQGGTGFANRLFYTSTGQSIYIGANSGNLTTTGGGTSVCVGFQTGLALTSGGSLTAVGYGAGQAVTTALANSAYGNLALSACTTGADNTAIGFHALTALISGSHNCSVGDNSADFLTTGSYNLVLGSNASGVNWTGAESSNIAIMNAGVLGESNVMRIGTDGSGNGQINKTFIAAIRGITTVNNNAIAVLIDSAGQLGTVSSSARFKENIKDMGDASSAIMSLRPVVFNFIADEAKNLCTGLIAEEVQKVAPSLVATDADGVAESVKYHELPALLLNELQKAIKRIEALEAKAS